MEQPGKHLEVVYKVMTDKYSYPIDITHKHSKHSFRRACQRSLSQEKITTALHYGEVIYKQGMLFYILGEKNIPSVLNNKKGQLRNTVVIVSGDSNQVITCYRSSNPFKNIKRKSKRLVKNYNNAA